jgi:hypothetical protein
MQARIGEVGGVYQLLRRDFGGGIRADFVFGWHVRS